MDCNKLTSAYAPKKRLTVAILISIAFHLLAISWLVITTPKLLTPKTNNKSIKSYIYHPINKSVDEISISPKKDIKTEKVNKTVHTETKENKTASTKVSNIEEVTATSPLKKTAKGDNTKNSFVDTAKILNDLVHKQTLNAQNNGALESYQQYRQQKNSIPRSHTKFNQLPVPKAAKVTIKCDNGFAKGLTILSGLMGGSINCEKYTGHQKHIDKRLKKMGK